MLAILAATALIVIKAVAKPIWENLLSVSHSTFREHAMNGHVHLHLSPDSIYPFDARGIAKRFRHAAIFGALDALNPGERMRFVNDHNPIPLLQQMQSRYGNAVEIRYLDQGQEAIVIDFIKK